jgi:hypothetical protein
VTADELIRELLELSAIDRDLPVEGAEFVEIRQGSHGRYIATREKRKW